MALPDSVDARSVAAEGLGDRLEERRSAKRAVARAARCEPERDRAGEERAAAVARLGADGRAHQSRDSPLRLAHGLIDTGHHAAVQPAGRAAALHVLADIRGVSAVDVLAAAVV